MDDEEQQPSPLAVSEVGSLTYELYRAEAGIIGDIPPTAQIFVSVEDEHPDAPLNLASLELPHDTMMDFARAYLERDGMRVIRNTVTVVCLIGSTRLGRVFNEVSLREALKGKAVFSIGSVLQSDEELHLSAPAIDILEQRHLHQIDLADEVFMLDLPGYVGESTTRELLYAEREGKRIRRLSADYPDLLGWASA